MLAIVRPERLDEVRAVCSTWGLASAVVGRLVAGGGLRVRLGGAVVAEVPARSLADEGPVYTRPMSPPAERDDLVADDPTFATFTTPPSDALLAVLASPNVASKRWVWEQYDSIVQGATVLGPGGDAALIRIEGTMKALALSTDGKGRFGALDPYLGAAHAVAEAARHVACTGATPLAITNCLNFGNPERPEVMWQFAESIRGMADACRALETPVTGGNVSFYNESGDSAIWPTPVIGMLGLIEDYRLAVRHAFADGALVYLLGETFPELGGSELAEVELGVVAGRPPALDLERERALHRLLVEAARTDLLRSAHDCGDGGLGVALAECAIAGGTGFAVSLPGDLPPHVGLFSESASRAVVTVTADRAGELEELAAAHAVPWSRLGETGGPRLVIDHVADLAVDEAAAAYEDAIPKLLAG
jgi:phosphoribosylformylglycinamidine synthase